ncbi:hypothetical protein F6979_01835 [Campylobacter jejuni]|nr:hypothetical protein [Campylobacter jejuni]
MIKTIKILAFLAIFAFALSIALCFYLFFDYFIEERNIIILTLIFISMICGILLYFLSIILLSFKLKSISFALIFLGFLFCVLASFGFYQCYIEYNNFLFSQTKGKLAFYFCAFFTTFAFILGYFHFKTMAKISSWNEFLFVYKFFMVALIVSYFNAFFGFFMLGASAILLFISWYKFKTLKES